MKKFLAICLSSTLQRTVTFEDLKLEKVNRSKKYRLDASGKAINSARILNQLEEGCVHTICPIGEQNQDQFIQLAAKDGLNMTCIVIKGNTRECWTLLDCKNHTTTELVVSEPVFESDDFNKMEQKLLKEIKNEVQNVDAVLLAGSRPEIWSKDLYSKIAKIVYDAKKIFLADFIGQDLQNVIKTGAPSIIKINEEEFAKTFNLKDYTKDQLKAEITNKSLELKNIIVVTRETEETFAACNGNFASVPTEKVKAVNTTACGDSFNAGFLYEYVNHGDFVAALKKGTWCASRNAEVETPGSIL